MIEYKVKNEVNVKLIYPITPNFSYSILLTRNNFEFIRAAKII